jgi:TPR repeat protein
MSHSTHSRREPILAKVSRKPGKVALLVKMYRGDLLFRSLLDLVVVGLIILAFTGNLPNPGSVLSSATRAILGTTDGAPSLGRPVDERLTRPIGIASFESIDDIPPIEDSLLDQAPLELRPILREARTLTKRGEHENALALLKPHTADKIVGYVFVVVQIYAPNDPEDIIPILESLKAAAENGIKEAFTTLGQLNMLLSMHYESNMYAGRLKIFPNALDGTGEPYVAEPKELRRQARQWWERGAALGEGASMRFLGMLEAKGLDEPPNISAAIAFWRDATRHGDAVAPMDLGLVHLSGTDVAGGKDEAIRYLETAIERGNWRAGGPLALELLARASNGDTAAARKAIDTLGPMIDLALAEQEMTGVAVVSEILATIYLDVAPPSMRDANRGVEYLRIAGQNKSLNAAERLSRFYETGTYVERDLVDAYRFAVYASSIAQGSAPTRHKQEEKSRAVVRAEERLEHLRRLMSAAQKKEADERRWIWTLHNRRDTVWIPGRGFLAPGGIHYYEWSTYRSEDYVGAL